MQKPVLERKVLWVYDPTNPINPQLGLLAFFILVHQGASRIDTKRVHTASNLEAVFIFYFERAELSLLQ